MAAGPGGGAILYPLLEKANRGGRKQRTMSRPRCGVSAV